MDYLLLSRVVSHALRHEPWVYELELDEEGWVSAEALLVSLRQERTEWEKLAEADLANMIERSEKQRHELKNGRVRALYGHSTPARLRMVRGTPPVALYHGTSPEVIAAIRADGLRPMGRQYVHLSTDIDTAQRVGQRKVKAPVILLISARRASEEGIAFYHGNDRVWLADAIPAAFLDRV